MAQTGARSVAERHLNQALGVFEQLGARARSSDTQMPAALLTTVGSGEYVISPADADDAIVRRIVDAAALPELLGPRDRRGADRSRRRRQRGGVRQPARRATCASSRRPAADADAARALARTAANGHRYGRGTMIVEPLGRDPEGPRFGLVAVAAPDRTSRAAPASHDRDGRATGLRAVRGARPAVRILGRPRPSIDRSSRSCRAS